MERTNHFFDGVEQLMEQALLGEVYTTPKPGLVDRKDNGAHRDMNCETFEKSTGAITPYLRQMVYEGYCSSKTMEELFLSIRKIGIRAEQAMFRATEGVNTHKGILFTMGILGAASGRCYQKESRICVSAILQMSQSMTEQILEKEFEEMEKRTPVTHGEKLYHRYGEKGIRGEAQKGFPIIRNIAYPAMCRYRGNGMSRNEANINVLLEVMTSLKDTNVVTRSNYEELTWIQKESARILKLGGAATEEGLLEIEHLNRQCIEKNISPGGAADILAATLFLYQLEENYGCKEI